MGILYVLDKFSFHMLNDVLLLRYDGVLRVLPVTASAATKLLREAGSDIEFNITSDTVRAQVIAAIGKDCAAVKRYVRMREGDELLVGLTTPQGVKWYHTSYIGEEQ